MTSSWSRITTASPSNEKEPVNDRSPVSRQYDKLPTDEAELTQMALGLRAEVRRLQTGLDVRNATLEIVKKRPGHRPEPADEQGEGPSGGLPEGQVEA